MFLREAGIADRMIHTLAVTPIEPPITPAMPEIRLMHYQSASDACVAAMRTP